MDLRTGFSRVRKAKITARLGLGKGMLLYIQNYRVQMESSDSEDVYEDESLKYRYIKRGHQII